MSSFCRINIVDQSETHYIKETYVKAIKALSTFFQKVNRVSLLRALSTFFQKVNRASLLKALSTFFQKVNRVKLVKVQFHSVKVDINVQVQKFSFSVNRSHTCYLLSVASTLLMLVRSNPLGFVTIGDKIGNLCFYFYLYTFTT